ncbi:hypothetical protein SAMN05421786_1056 [Chryseobacterium ureilyticum]|uniref:Uncharacterized protein n=2 Tax=Flavobacteriia TaxID=117743 RepID=A0A1N7PAP8_9FLAO|nr:hypothetical protein SAMN05421786_1056 [Chryseobacterium ureilyticum]
MIPPKKRSEMEHNFFLALEDFNQRINSGDKDRIENAVWATAEHIKRVKTTPNNRVDVSTINKNMRLQANMRKWMDV